MIRNTEEQIEARVQSMTDAADRALMKGVFTQAAYDEHMRDINKWADRQREKLKS